MYITYTEKVGPSTYPFIGEAIECRILEDGALAVWFNFPLDPQDMNGIQVKASIWDFARARTWTAYRKYTARKEAQAAGHAASALTTIAEFAGEGTPA